MSYIKPANLLINNQMSLTLPPSVQQNIPLAPYTTLQVGGCARYFCVINDLATLETVLDWAQQAALPWFILGGGSNLLVDDAGFEGLVLHLNTQDQQVNFITDPITTPLASNEQPTTTAQAQVLLTVAAGVVWDRLVAQTVEAGWQGLECLSGIPGKVGATPIQNVGAYGQEVSQTIAQVIVYDPAQRQLRTLSNHDCQFDYRSSIFKINQLHKRDPLIVWSVTYRLNVAAPAMVRYPELARYLTTHHNWPTKDVDLATVRAAVLHLRRQKSMVLDAADPNTRSAGSFFVNPVVSPAILEDLKRRLSPIQREQMPQFPTSTGQIKLSAAWLIEQAGFKKGYRDTKVGLSTNHALALVNYEQAAAADILALANSIQSQVYQQWGILLVLEPVYVGQPSAHQTAQLS
jgi:UDP-N-acetylmuramate dehydrogenase